MNIYTKDTTVFNNNGLGYLTDSINASVTEILNGEMSLSIEYPMGGALSDYLIEENIIKANVGNNNYQLFRIKTIDKTSTRIKVYAIHIFYDLIDNFLVDVAPTNLNCQSAVEWILARTQFANTFTAQSTISTTKSARYVRRNPVEAIMGDIDNSILKNYNAELERDNFNIKLLNRRGADNKVKLIFGKNIREIGITIDNTNVMTRIMPIGYNALILPELFIDSPLIANYPQPKIKKIQYDDVKYDPNDPQAYQTEEEAYTELRNRVNALYTTYQVDQPTISVKVNWVELSKVQEYYDKYSALETVRLGDTITAELYGLNYSTRCIKTVYNILKDTIDQFEIGTFKPTYINTTTAQINSLADKVEEVNPANILEQAQNTATSLITSAMGGYVYKTQNELFIMDSNDPDTAQQVWRWNLNGLGYSSTGINGTYETAITGDGKIVADFITVGAMSTSRISGLQDILNGITTQMNLNQNDIQFLIPQVTEIQENGVAKLINTLVTIDDDGIGIAKTGEQMSLKLGYFDAGKMGLQVNRDTEELLGVDNTGVRSENLHVRKYFIMGDNSRYENYQGGTGCFYIGEEV